MSEEEAFDAELENLEGALDRARQEDAHKYQEHEAVRRRFEESEVWNEHKRWHEEQGTHGKLVVQETEVPVMAPPEQQAESQDQPHPKLVRFGVCQCQPFNALMQLDDRGQVIAGAPALDEQPVYGAAGASTTDYSAQGNSPSGAYQIDPSLNKDLYR